LQTVSNWCKKAIASRKLLPKFFNPTFERKMLCYGIGSGIIS
jgi:hypothetical protein